MYYIIRIRGSFDIYTNLPGNFQADRDEVVVSKLTKTEAHRELARLTGKYVPNKRQFIAK